MGAPPFPLATHGREWGDPAFWVGLQKADWEGRWKGTCPLVLGQALEVLPLRASGFHSHQRTFVSLMVPQRAQILALSELSIPSSFQLVLLQIGREKGVRLKEQQDGVSAN